MDPRDLMKQMIRFNRQIFDNTFDAVTTVLEQREKMINLFFEQTPWFPEEGKRIVNEWVKAYKKGRSDFKASIDENYKKVEEYLSMDAEKKNTDK